MLHTRIGAAARTPSYQGKQHLDASANLLTPRPPADQWERNAAHQMGVAVAGLLTSRSMRPGDDVDAGVLQRRLKHRTMQFA